MGGYNFLGGGAIMGKTRKYDSMKFFALWVFVSCLDSLNEVETVFFLRNAILYEPKSRDELLRLENHFTQLKTRVYFVGYVEQRSGLGCENKGDFVYHGISSCTDAPKGLFFEKEPNNCEGLGEWCVVSREHGGERYLNFRSCNFTGVDFVVCQFNKHCGN